MSLTNEEINLLKSLISKLGNLENVTNTPSTDVVSDIPVNAVKKQKVRIPFATNHIYTYNGKTQSLQDWCKELGISYKLAYRRIVDLGWSVEKAFTTDVRVGRAKPRAKHEELECPICHQKFKKINSLQKTCNNKHCRAVAYAKTVRDRLYKIRMAELGKDIEELVE